MGYTEMHVTLRSLRSHGGGREGVRDKKWLSHTMGDRRTEGLLRDAHGQRTCGSATSHS